MRQPTRSPFAPHRPRAALGMALALLAPALLALPTVQATLPNENALFYPDWSMDRNPRNGLDDALDQDLAAGATGPVWLHVHYDHRPTASDAELLRSAYGATGTYVFQNWDDIQARTTYAHVAAIRGAPGVVAVEKFDPPSPDLAQSTASVRARSAAGVPVEEGIDHLLAAHESLGFRGEGMVIAILDTGVDNLHESLDDLDDDPATDDPKLVHKTDPVTGQRVWAGAEVQDGTTVTGCIDPVDDGAHGTHVAGIALGTGGPSHVNQGMAPQAKLVDIDIAPVALGLGMALGFDWIMSFNAGTTCFGPPGDDRIDVCNLSYGMSGGDNPEASTQRKFTDVVRSGVTCIVSAGNSGSGAQTLTKGPEGLVVVADVENRNTVVRTDDRLSSTSSRGPRVATDGDADPLDQLMPHVAAPGTDILAPAVGTLNQYVSLSGTSMAAPHVAGLAALMLQANPALKPVDKGSTAAMGDPGAVPVRDVLIKTAQYKSATNGPPPQAAQTGRFGQGWNNGWGYGMVDAYAAVRFGQAPGQLHAGAGLPQTAGVGEPVVLQAQATGGSAPYTFAWDFGDGATGAGAIAVHPYAAVGTYTATVTVTDATGAVDTATTTVTVVSVGIPGRVVEEWSFDGSDGASCDTQGWISRSGRLASASTSKPYASAGGSQWHLVQESPSTAPCAWYFGLDLTREYLDNTVTQLDSPAGADCLWVPPGTKAIRVTYRLAGETETGYDQMQVLVQPGACIPDTPDNFLSSAATFLAVDQVEGTVGDLANGVYDAKVANLDPALGAIRDAGGNFQVRFRFYSDPQVFLQGYQLDDVRLHVDNEPPVLAGVADATLFSTETLAFKLQASDPEGDPITFGVASGPEGLTVDGAGNVQWSPGDDQDGVHTVVFQATDGLGTTEASATITVLNVPPTAAGSADRAQTDRLTPVHFTDASTDPDGSIVAWRWEFGDGATSALQNPTHTYAKLGTKEVWLTATDDDGASHRAFIGLVKVKNVKPNARFDGTGGQPDAFRPEGGAAPSEVLIEANRVAPAQFQDLSTDPDGAVQAWAWAFGDGATSTAQDPSHQYGQLGDFGATLVATDNDGDAGAPHTVTVRVVNLPPQASFEVQPAHPMALTPTLFDSTASDLDGTVVGYLWEFGDGATSTAADPAHVYLQGGWHTVTLTVTDNDGGVRRVVQPLYVCAPGADAATLLELEHVRLEFEACLHVAGVDWPF